MGIKIAICYFYFYFIDYIFKIYEVIFKEYKTHGGDLMEAKHEKFVRLAESRTNTVLKK